MKTEIKFRIWCPKHRTFAYMDNILDTIVTINGQRRNIGYYEEYDLGENLIIQQFTGLSDKNGKEIYEGDVIKTYREYVLVVVFENGAFILTNKQKTYSTLLGWQSDYESNEMDWVDLDDIEVIGNIYENQNYLIN